MRAVLEWLLAIPRLVGAPLRWMEGRLRRYGADRRDLLQQGSSVVTPVIQFTKGLGPPAVAAMGDRDLDDVLAYVDECRKRWPKLRDDLMTYANHHESGIAA